MLNQPDKAVVGRLLRGDEAAFEEFFETYSSRLYRFAIVRLERDPDAAEEVVQAALSNSRRQIGHLSRGGGTLQLALHVLPP